MAVDIAKSKELKNLQVNWISLVENPANQREFIFKSADKNRKSNISKSIKISKAESEKHLIYGIVYEPDIEDAHGEFATAETIEKACHGFSENYRQWAVDSEHNEMDNRSIVVENFILKGDHSMVDAADGSWIVVIKVNDVDTWESVKDGTFTGLSMAGWAESTETEKAATSAALEAGKVIDFIKSFFGNKDNNNNSTESEMNAQEIAAVVKTAVEQGNKPLLERIEKLEKSEDAGTSGQGNQSTGSDQNNDSTGNIEKSEVEVLREEFAAFKKSAGGRLTGDQDRLLKDEDDSNDLDIF